MAPGMGDDVQAIKAGILECADVFAVNKADRDGADATVRDLELMIALGGEVSRSGAHSRGHAGAVLDLAKQEVKHAEGTWVPLIVRTVASRAQGIDKLVEGLAAHRAWLEGTEAGAARRAQRLREAMRMQLREALIEVAEASLGPAIEEAVHAVARREKDPYTAAEGLVAAFRGEPL
jgi:LAO/AO transport system kinase